MAQHVARLMKRGGGLVLGVGALLFLPVAVLGPVAEHMGPLPFGG